MNQVGVLDIFAGQAPENLLPHDVGEAHDGVEGRAQLVAHIGQKAGLAEVESLGVGPRGLQHRFAAAPGGGV